ncbi:helix-turn-helix domain-containing protein [Mycobacterium sp. CVI_P3]|uniref:Helix-turn-helix domain-containing protein n=1 Tax=Mycobacterium pinniadriaticum TaxID=2994102 RepID=A0ABT3SH87_9MYCO|nr:helix-turn-helix domain-containing protein [Mycobacterium pinniadriaticum]MCX2932090.1 helix-turn-helix domain-containing protein [Mycobacterium pinniadriaticum]MCX2938514.1 helix-turn-helix domain-containing protein [Mycobacterium pinniadriaticum]
MSAEAAETVTFIPEDPDQLATVVGFLASHERIRGKLASPSYALVGIGEHDRIELPRSVHQALTKVVAALHAGKAVTIAPQTMTLTTQQAADLLGVSRPTVVRLITDGTLPAERIGNRHRLLLDDVLAYREQRRNRQYEALAATTVDINADDDPEVVRQRLREARRVVAARRRAKAGAR